MAQATYTIDDYSYECDKYGNFRDGKFTANMEQDSPALGSETGIITKIWSTWSVSGSAKWFGNYDATTKLKLVKEDSVLYDSGEHQSSDVDASAKNVTGNTVTAFSTTITDLIKQGELSLHIFMKNHDTRYAHTIYMKNMKLYIEYENVVFSFNVKLNGIDVDIIKLNGVEVDALTVNGTLISTGTR